MKVDALIITGKAPDGQVISGLECSECGQEFFDAITEDVFSPDSSLRIVESAVAKFIDHADQEHHSTGGVIGGARRDKRRLCA